MYLPEDDSSEISSLTVHTHDRKVSQNLPSAALRLSVKKKVNILQTTR